MSKVIEFPTSERKAVSLLQQLESGAEDLEELYELLDNLHSQLHKAEESAEKIEATYNKNMREYVKHVPIDEVPLVLMQYSSEARMSMNDDKQVTFSFEGEENED
jgi:hypothetical protein